MVGKKHEIYSELLETLYHLKKYASEHLDHYCDPDSIDEANEKELQILWRESSAKLGRLEDLASFHLSARAVQILADYRRERAKARDPSNFYEWIDGDLAAKKCLEALKNEAKRD